MFDLAEELMKKFRFIIPLLFLFSCINEKESTLPVLAIEDVSDITQKSVVLQSNISDDGGAEITGRGICWSVSPNPRTEGNKTTDGLGSGSFSSTIAGLEENTTYYLRAYAVNEAGTGYSSQLEIRTGKLEPWMKLPYFALPSTGVSLMVGQEVTIYGDALINVPVRNNLQVTYSCNTGTKSGINYVFKPVAGDTGDHTLTMTFRSNGILLTAKTIKVTIYPKAGAGNKKILLIGDSTMPPDVQQAKIKTVLNNTALTFLGTVGSIYKNEGYGGASWNSYLTGTHGKFTKNGVLNIPAYFSDYSVETPDYVYIRLGINDTFPFCEDGSGPITDEAIAEIISNAKRLIDAFLGYNANLKVILGIPTITENSGEGWKKDYGDSRDQNLFIEQIHRYWTTFTETFANGSYNPRVDCSYDAIFLDRDEGYPKAGAIHNNGVHPDQSGFEQLATGMALTFNKLINAE